MSESRRDNFGEAESRNASLPHRPGFSGFGFNVRNISLLLIATLSAASMWFYADRILIGHQLKDAAEYGRPRGNLSDLYPRWVGARELLFHHRNPYGDDVTVEIQKGFYGRPIDPARPNDPKDQQGFAYPVYVVFLLAPLLWRPFHDAQLFFYWLLVFGTIMSVWLWLRVLRWRLPLVVVASAMMLAVGSTPAMQGIKLQQLSLFVGVLTAISIACISEGYLFVGGVLLALATIKPQLAWPAAAALLLWSIADWRRRRGFAMGFALTMVLLMAGAEIVLPAWWKYFAEGIQRYHAYTQNQSVIEVTLGEFFGEENSVKAVHLVAQLLAVGAVGACGMVMWKWRKIETSDSEFPSLVALVLALTVLIVPMYAPYNQVLLLPVVLVLVKERREFFARAQWRRMILAVGGIILVWQWVASISLAAVYLLVSQERALQDWTWPFFGTIALPLWTFGLIFIHLRAKPLRFSAAGSSSEMV
jgi:hypothetical protein